MILRDFISQALLDIVGGVQDSQSKTTSGTIVPIGLSTKLASVEAGFSAYQVVDFEVTVKAEKLSGRESGLSVVSAVLGVGGGIKTRTGKTGGHDATLRFRIPVRLPTGGNQEV